MARSRLRQQHWSWRTADCRYCARVDRQAYAYRCLDADAVRRDRRIGLLSRRPPRPMPRTLHHGFSLHRLRHRHDDSANSRASMAPPHRPLARVLRLHRHRRLGLRQHLHRTPLGSSVGQERSTAHLHGHSLVVCRSTGNLAVSSSFRTTTKKRLTWHRDHAHRLGYVRPPARPPPLNNGPLRLRLDPHGSGRCTHRRDLLSTQRLPRQHRAEQLATSHSLPAIRFRPPLPLRHRAANVPPQRPRRHPRLLRPAHLLRRLPHVSLRQHPAAHLRAGDVAGRRQQWPWSSPTTSERRAKS